VTYRDLRASDIPRALSLRNQNVPGGAGGLVATVASGFLLIASVYTGVYATVSMHMPGTLVGLQACMRATGAGGANVWCKGVCELVRSIADALWGDCLARDDGPFSKTAKPSLPSPHNSVEIS
jgi:hypothetical protein